MTYSSMPVKWFNFGGMGHKFERHSPATTIAEIFCRTAKLSDAKTTASPLSRLPRETASSSVRELSVTVFCYIAILTTVDAS
jgi:hypothetical protein